MMSICSVIQSMRVAGVSAEQILLAVEKLATMQEEQEAAKVNERRERVRSRVKRHREAKRGVEKEATQGQKGTTEEEDSTNAEVVETVTPCNGYSALQPVTSVTSFTPSLSPPTTPPYSPPLSYNTPPPPKGGVPPTAKTSQTQPKPQASPLPHTELPDDWRKWALENLSWPDEVTADVWITFAEYWQAKVGKVAKKSDWFATWRNWCRNERPKTFKTGATHAKPYSNPSKHQIIMQTLADRKARREREAQEPSGGDANGVFCNAEYLR